MKEDYCITGSAAGLKSTDDRFPEELPNAMQTGRRAQAKTKILVPAKKPSSLSDLGLGFLDENSIIGRNQAMHFPSFVLQDRKDICF